MEDMKKGKNKKISVNIVTMVIVMLFFDWVFLNFCFQVRYQIVCFYLFNIQSKLNLNLGLKIKGNLI
uniref:Uncharacterized protein n=1 Tax=Tetranychus urticae TaxID=32264 RepID=T1KYC2_TETUR